MSVRIKSIAAAGNLDKERIVMSVLAKDDIGSYAVLRSHCRDDGGVTTKVSHVFWFPDKLVASGDFVVLYSKEGVNKSRANTNGTSSHFFYWRSDKPLWKGSGYAAVLLHVDEWDSYNPATKE